MWTTIHFINVVAVTSLPSKKQYGEIISWRNNESPTNQKFKLFKYEYLLVFSTFNNSFCQAKQAMEVGQLG